MNSDAQLWAAAGAYFGCPTAAHARAADFGAVLTTAGAPAATMATAVPPAATTPAAGAPVDATAVTASASSAAAQAAGACLTAGPMFGTSLSMALPYGTALAGVPSLDAAAAHGTGLGARIVSTFAADPASIHVPPYAAPPFLEGHVNHTVPDQPDLHTPRRQKGATAQEQGARGKKQPSAAPQQQPARTLAAVPSLEEQLRSTLRAPFPKQQPLQERPQLRQQQQQQQRAGAQQQGWRQGANLQLQGGIGPQGPPVMNAALLASLAATAGKTARPYTPYAAPSEASVSVNVYAAPAAVAHAMPAVPVKPLIGTVALNDAAAANTAVTFTAARAAAAASGNATISSVAAATPAVTTATPPSDLLADSNGTTKPDDLGRLPPQHLPPEVLGRSGDQGTGSADCVLRLSDNMDIATCHEAMPAALSVRITRAGYGTNFIVLQAQDPGGSWRPHNVELRSSPGDAVGFKLCGMTGIARDLAMRPGDRLRLRAQVGSKAVVERLPAEQDCGLESPLTAGGQEVLRIDGRHVDGGGALQVPQQTVARVLGPDVALWGPGSGAVPVHEAVPVGAPLAPPIGELYCCWSQQHSSTSWYIVGCDDWLAKVGARAGDGLQLGALQLGPPIAGQAGFSTSGAGGGSKTILTVRLQQTSPPAAGVPVAGAAVSGDQRRGGYRAATAGNVGPIARPSLGERNSLKLQSDDANHGSSGERQHQQQPRLQPPPEPHLLQKQVGPQMPQPHRMSGSAVASEEAGRPLQTDLAPPAKRLRLQGSQPLAPAALAPLRIPPLHEQQKPLQPVDSARVGRGEAGVSGVVGPPPAGKRPLPLSAQEQLHPLQKQQLRDQRPASGVMSSAQDGKRSVLTSANRQAVAREAHGTYPRAAGLAVSSLAVNSSGSYPGLGRTAHDVHGGTRGRGERARVLGSDRWQDNAHQQQQQQQQEQRGRPSCVRDDYDFPYLAGRGERRVRQGPAAAPPQRRATSTPQDLAKGWQTDGEPDDEEEEAYDDDEEQEEDETGDLDEELCPELLQMRYAQLLQQAQICQDIQLGHMRMQQHYERLGQLLQVRMLELMGDITTLLHEEYEASGPLAQPPLPPPTAARAAKARGQGGGGMPVAARPSAAARFGGQARAGAVRSGDDGLLSQQSARLGPLPQAAAPATAAASARVPANSLTAGAPRSKPSAPARENGSEQQQQDAQMQPVRKSRLLADLYEPQSTMQPQGYEVVQDVGGGGGGGSRPGGIRSARGLGPWTSSAFPMSQRDRRRVDWQQGEQDDALDGNDSGSEGSVW